MTLVNLSKPDSDDLENMELKDIDLQSIVVACERKEEHSIIDNQINHMKTALIKSRNKEKLIASQKGKKSFRFSLGINNSSSIKPIKFPKDDK